MELLKFRSYLSSYFSNGVENEIHLAIFYIFITTGILLNALQIYKFHVTIIHGVSENQKKLSYRKESRTSKAETFNGPTFGYSLMVQPK